MSWMERLLNFRQWIMKKLTSFPLVMNFANAHKPGGGFELGATAQEEALCRCSTLIASIGSAKAKEMYQYNNSYMIPVEFLLHR